MSSRDSWPESTASITRRRVMILVTLAGSSFSWALSSSSMVPLSFSISTQDAQDTVRPLSAGAALDGKAAAASITAARMNDVLFLIMDSS